MFSSIRGIGFDLDNTVYSEDEYFREIIRLAGKVLKESDFYHQETFNKVRSSSTSDFFGDYLKEMGCYSFERQEQLFRLYKTASIEVQVPEQNVDILLKLKDKYKTAVLTNGVIEAQKNKVRLLGVEELVHTVIFAREKGKEFEKPHFNAFQRLADGLGFASEEILFIGDNPITDIEGARRFGMLTIWTSEWKSSKQENKVGADFQISLLNDLSFLI